MEFISLLKEQRSDGGRVRVLQSLEMKDDLLLSIQASYGHYCTPQKDLPLKEYTAMEVAIMRNDFFLMIFEVTDDEELIKKFEEYETNGVYAYVPVELIERLYQELK